MKNALSMLFTPWRPGLGIARLAFVCGVLGASVSVVKYWRPVWLWADSIFWPHAYYQKLAATPGVVKSDDEYGNPALMLVRRSTNQLPPEGFHEAYDLSGTPTKDQWAASKPADPNQTSDYVLMTREDWGVPTFASLRTHPPGTQVYFTILPKGSQKGVATSGYLRFIALIAVPCLGFLIPFGLTIAAAWIVDGFKR